MYVRTHLKSSGRPLNRRSFGLPHSSSCKTSHLFTISHVNSFIPASEEAKSSRQLVRTKIVLHQVPPTAAAAHHYEKTQRSPCHLRLLHLPSPSCSRLRKDESQHMQLTKWREMPPDPPLKNICGEGYIQEESVPPLGILEVRRSVDITFR